MRLSAPTSRDDWRLVVVTAIGVLSRPRFALIAVLASVGALTAIAAVTNPNPFLDLVVFGNLPVRARLEVLADLYPLVGVGYSLTQSLSLVTIAALIGIDIAMVSYYVLAYGAGIAGGSGGVVSAVLATLGAGCSACGPTIAAGLLSAVGAGFLLPFGGDGLLVLAIVLVVLSIYWIADGLAAAEAEICPLE